MAYKGTPRKLLPSAMNRWLDELLRSQDHVGCLRALVERIVLSAYNPRTQLHRSLCLNSNVLYKPTLKGLASNREKPMYQQRQMACVKVLAVMALHADACTRIVCDQAHDDPVGLALKTIAKEHHLSEPQMHRVIRVLRDEGFITRHQRVHEDSRVNGQGKMRGRVAVTRISRPLIDMVELGPDWDRHSKRIYDQRKAEREQPENTSSPEFQAGVLRRFGMSRRAKRQADHARKARIRADKKAAEQLAQQQALAREAARLAKAGRGLDEIRQRHGFGVQTQGRARPPPQGPPASAHDPPDTS